MSLRPSEKPEKNEQYGEHRHVSCIPERRAISENGPCNMAKIDQFLRTIAWKVFTEADQLVVPELANSDPNVAIAFLAGLRVSVGAQAGWALKHCKTCRVVMSREIAFGTIQFKYPGIIDNPSIQAR